MTAGSATMAVLAKMRRRPRGIHPNRQYWDGRRVTGVTDSSRARHSDGQTPDGDGDGEVSVGSRVRIHPDTDGEVCGTVVEDFGENASAPIDIGDRVVDPARRWAVISDDGTLVFADNHEIVAD
jgi:hypothetical protein